VSLYISRANVDEVDRRIAPVSARRLGRALHDQRHKAGVGAGALPDIGDRALADFESGHCRPDAATLITMMDAYGCDLDDVVPPRIPLPATDTTGWSEAQVLTHHLAAVKRWRNADNRQTRFREQDLAVLVTILGTEPKEILDRLVALTGCSRTVAKRFRRVLGCGVALASLTALSLPALTMGHGAGASSATHSSDVVLSRSVNATPVHASLPAATDYTLWGRGSDGRPYRWNPHHVVTVSYVLAAGAPSLDISGAVTQLAHATGLSIELVRAGTADITITFASQLRGRLAGSTSEERDTDGYIDKATVVLSEQTPRSLLRTALLHELGHAVGLGHAPRPGQVMDPVLSGQSQYQAGDLAGLRAVGPAGGT
jgi:matrixin